MNRNPIQLCVLGITFLINTMIGFGQWSLDPTINHPVCLSPYIQKSSVTISDGNQGAFIIWEDQRNGNWDIYSQHLDVNGYVQWTTNGIPVCTASGDQQSITAVPDGSGGVIVAWFDKRNNNPNLYSQRIQSNGTMLWATNGVQVCGSDHVYESRTALVGDSTGGAVVAWMDNRNGGTNLDHIDLFAQRVDSNGNMLWTANGVAVDTIGIIWFYPRMVMDTRRSAIIVWDVSPWGNGRSLSDIYAQRIDTSGNILWTSGRKAVCAYSSQKSEQIDIVSTSGNGAIVSWNDWRNEWDIYIQRIDSSGSVLWTSTGVPVCNLSGSNVKSVGNMHTAWDDNGVMIMYDNKLQRVDSSGTLLALSTGVCPNNSCQKMVPCGPYGTIISGESSGMWPSGMDIYAQRVDTSGQVCWGSSGISVAVAYYDQTEHSILGNTSGNAILAWTDARNSVNTDIYSQAVFQNGTLPVELGLFVANIAGERINLNWTAVSEVNVLKYEIERRTNDSAWLNIGQVTANGTSDKIQRYCFTDKKTKEIVSDTVYYRLRIVDRDGSIAYSPQASVYWGVTLHLELLQNIPNPVVSQTKISYHLPDDGSVVLDVVDMLGKQVIVLVDESQTRGWHQRTLNVSSLLSGNYFYRLSSGTSSIQRAMRVLK